LAESYLLGCSATATPGCNHSIADVDIPENSCIFANQNVQYHDEENTALLIDSQYDAGRLQQWRIASR
jgi:hypothetical protein